MINLYSKIIAGGGNNSDNGDNDATCIGRKSKKAFGIPERW
jgi:hypothetical protein